MARASREYDDLPREHVIRPRLPWRLGGDLTECGKAAKKSALSREEFIDKVRKQGPTRAQLTTCITCFQAAQRWPDWGTNPAGVIARELNKYSYWADESNALFKDELRAIALLIQEHREEFDETLAALAATVPLTRRRDQQRRRL